MLRGNSTVEVPRVEHDAMGRCPRVGGDDVGTGDDLNVPATTADLDPLADEREGNGVRPSLERDRAIDADAAPDGNVERCQRTKLTDPPVTGRRATDIPQ